ncbi:hypothetical protein [Herbidospora yilanensis]|uniref:hypothetical protein n=1 Tax=Herbidospora yilanensis TaxID=354426 RepID=UPI0007843931|nr:hypothetical protein [Herbidospora yilanensis]
MSISPEGLPARPDPADARSDAEFVAMLRRLKAWSGRSYRDIQLHAQRAGHHLPYSTAAGMLKRGTLPRREAVTAFVLGCGLDEQAATAWNTARTRLDLNLPPEPEREPEPVPAPPRRRLRTALVAAVAMMAATLVVAAGVHQTEDETALSDVPARHGQVLD